MRILMLCDRPAEPAAGGSERTIVELSSALRRAGHDVDVCCGPAPRPGPPGWTTLTVAAALSRRLPRMLRRGRPDVVHVHHPVAARVARRFDVPQVRTVHGDVAAERSARGRSWGPADAIGAVAATPSPALAERLGIAWIPGGVDGTRFAPATERRPGPLRVGCLTRLVPERHVERLVGLDVVVAGPGPLRARLGAAGVRCVGRVDDAAAFLRDLDLYVNPAGDEAFGLATLEAMACGLPVVSAPGPGPARLAGDPPAIWLGDLTDGVARLRADAELRRELGRRARQRALTFGWDRVADAYLGLYRRAAGNVRCVG